MAKEVVLACIRTDPENVEVMKEPFVKALRNEWESIKTVYQTKRYALFDSLTPCEDTVFHIAAYMGSVKLLRALFEMVPVSRKWEVLVMKNIHGNTLLHEAATNKNVDEGLEAVKFLVEIANGERATMLMDQNGLGETPLYRAAAFGTKATVEYLANEVEKEVGILQGNFTRSYDNLPILHVAIMNENFEAAIWLLDKDPDLAMLKDFEKTCLQVLAGMSTSFKSSSGKMSGLKETIYRKFPHDLVHKDETDRHVPSQCCETRKGHQPMIGYTSLSMHRCFWIRFWTILEEWHYIKEIRERRRKHELGAKLAEMLVKKDSSSWRKHYHLEEHNTNICFLRDKETAGEEESEVSSKTGGIGATDVSLSDTPLIIAASTGILEIVEMIHKEYPQALEHVTENGQNILHVAILYRRNDIFEYVDKEGGAVNSRLVLGIDNDGDTILHKAASTKYYHGGTKSTIALKLQEELKWFKEVAKKVPASYTIHRNKKNKTPKELFKDQHQEQLKEAQEWVKNTCQSCSTVAVLVATVVFTAVFTAPGGFKENQGYAVLEKKPLYSFFTVMDVAGLANSLTSVVIFLSVLTSSLDLADFHSTIPRKLAFGFTCLFLGIATTVLSFTAAIILTIHLKKAWTASLTYAAAFLPVGVYAIVQFGLYIEFFNSAVISILELVKILLPGI
ncbi:hypothetical protein SLE2022_320750 [Rubroshorea leprosula]